MFLDLDDDGDKILSWDEFTDVFMKKDPKKIQENELAEAFKGLDKDGSGRLSDGEVRQAFAALGINISDDELANTMKQADVDGDGKIDFKEFLKAWGSA
nr:hypothetical protein BaRGS_034210 [Batillaria attramentaria]